MKKIILFFAFLGTFGLNASYAQCSQAKAAACNKSKASSCCAAKASKAASADATIEMRTAEDGKVAYVRKEVDAQGNARFVSVQFDEASSEFVNVAPPSAAAPATMAKKSCSANKAACCSKGGKKAGCSGEAKAAAPAQEK